MKYTSARPERQVTGDERESFPQELDDQAVHFVRRLLLHRMARLRDGEKRCPGDPQSERSPQPNRHEPVLLSPEDERGSCDVLEATLQTVEVELSYRTPQRPSIARFHGRRVTL